MNVQEFSQKHSVKLFYISIVLLLSTLVLGVYVFEQSKRPVFPNSSRTDWSQMRQGQGQGRGDGTQSGDRRMLQRQPGVAEGTAPTGTEAQ